MLVCYIGLEFSLVHFFAGGADIVLLCAISFCSFCWGWSEASICVCAVVLYFPAHTHVLLLLWKPI